jgi:ATP-dependent helicase HrpA
MSGRAGRAPTEIEKRKSKIENSDGCFRFGSRNLRGVSAARPNAFPFRLGFPPELPISARAEEITAALQASQVVIIAGETGSGKTTQLPKMCLAAGRGSRGRIACTQPRRVAALSISRRVAEELDVPWGREVGCKIRFSDQTTPQTVIKFLTDGMLLAEVQGDPLLREYDTIIIDEAHERSLNIDFLIGHLRTLRYKRPELSIVITSATIDTEAFSAAFECAPVIKVEGRTFPVEVIYAPLDGSADDDGSLSPGEEAVDEDAKAAGRAAHQAERAEAVHYIDGAVDAVERIVRESTSGDVLVFLPAERDIREAGDLLEGRRLPGCELVPLYGRLSNAEQQRVFAPSQRRKIVLATNIAETSLTIPGIRFVVDSGLARMSRYSPQARTRRLPIEEISQSSADQRKGRSGRVAEGVCIRLYSEKDYLERPRFTQPEIQRANLADVVLRMKAFGLGDIERFPFLNMPAAKSIRAGYALLEELGAIREAGDTSLEGGVRSQESGGNSQDKRPTEGASGGRGLTLELTGIGRELARLPVDPTVGRMILQARAEQALREVIVIAAGLSIQDPRERPLDKQQQADAAHRKFVHPDSDFLTLLKIWETYHDEFETLSQARLRRFCRDHFLNYARMREWRDIHAQLLDVLRERDDFRMTSAFDGAKPASKAPTKPEAKPPPGQSKHRSAAPPKDPLAFGTPAYRAIHRSILAGLLGNIAHYDEESGMFKATHDRKVVLFPGSVLFRRDETRKSSGLAKSSAPREKAKVPRWIMASEIMETSRLYARTCARLDPAWALDLGAHVVRVAHSEPFWNEEQGRVLVKQRTRLYGLELESRAVGYGKIDPVHATEIFIREGLVNDAITFPLDFISHNRVVRQKIEDLLTRTRDPGYLNLDEAAYHFYAARLLPETSSGTGLPTREDPVSRVGRPVPPQPAGISAVAELVDLVRERRGAEPRFLMMEPEDLRDPTALAHDAEAYPAALPLDNRALPLNYAYRPGQSDDGVTLEVSVPEAAALTPADLDWAVPGHLEAKIEHYLRALPKNVRIQLAALVPLGDAARDLAAELPRLMRLVSAGKRPSLTDALVRQLEERFGLRIDPAAWAEKPLPDHLRVRVRVVDDKGRELGASRDLAEIAASLRQHHQAASVAVARAEPVAWKQARAKWETTPQTTWTFGNVPDRIVVMEQAGVPVYAYPGLQAELAPVVRKTPPGSGRAMPAVALRLFLTVAEAHAATKAGLAALLERELSHELGWLERDLRAIRLLGPLLALLPPPDELQAQTFASIRRWVCDPVRVMGRPASDNVTGGVACNQEQFQKALTGARADLVGIVPRFTALLKEILLARQALLVTPKPPPWLADDLAALLPPDFLGRTPYPQLAHFPRYLKALKLRVDRWRQNPAKDAERAGQLAPYVAAVTKLRRSGGTDAVESLRWLVEELRVSLFAQELGTAEPVSTVKLDRALAAVGSPGSAREEPVVAPKPIVAATKREKTAPLKNLNALGGLFQR